MAPQISYIVPTHNRPQMLDGTLAAIDRLGPHDAEVIIVDNASLMPAVAPAMLSSGVPVALLRQERNLGAAARNLAAKASQGEWLVMLDDDSHPTDLGFARCLEEATPATAALMADITLRSGVREQGGLPEVFIGCGVAIRREAFLAAGGYDPSFHYYVEEYDLAARLIAAGAVIAMDGRFRITHEKTAQGRDFPTIVSRLVRNNGWVVQRYAPTSNRREEAARSARRYRSIANREQALRGYRSGMLELWRTRRGQPRRELSPALWDRFTGLTAARESVARAMTQQHIRRAALIGHGKNAWVVEEALLEAGVVLTASRSAADACFIGTMSPGPMLDALDAAWRSGTPVIAPWSAAATILRQGPIARDDDQRVMSRVGSVRI